MAQIEGADEYWALGEVPIEWVEKRIMGLATTDKDYADVCSSEWIGRLRKSLATHGSLESRSSTCRSCNKRLQGF